MTDDKARDEQFEQAAEIFASAMAVGGGVWTDGDMATCIIDAGWRPPPSGNVVEQAADTIHESIFDVQSHGRQECLDAARLLASRGLLATPAQQDVKTVERVAKALHEHDGDWCPVTWQQLTENGRNDYREQARAALRALGEPQQDERPGFVGMFRGAPDLSVRAKDIARGREVGSDGRP